MSISRPRSIYICLCDIFFTFSLIFIVINYIISFEQTHLIFVHFLECLLSFLDDSVEEESEWFSNSKSSVSGCCLPFVRFFLPTSAYKTVAYVLWLINELIAFSSCGMSKARFYIVTNSQLRINRYKRENGKQKGIFMKKCLHYIKLQLLSFGLDVLKDLLAKRNWKFAETSFTFFAWWFWSILQRFTIKRREV